MVVVEHDTAATDILRVAEAHGFSRFPVFQRESRSYVGVVHVLDLIYGTVPKGRQAQDYMRAPQFVSEETPVDALLPRMRLTRQPMLLVKDKQSRIVGLVTVEDVLEEIVGEL
jgi:CBS domain containing-hemolysin-like protein